MIVYYSCVAILFILKGELVNSHRIYYSHSIVCGVTNSTQHFNFGSLFKSIVMWNTKLLSHSVNAHQMRTLTPLPQQLSMQDVFNPCYELFAT